MKEKIIIFIIGLLAGAVLSTGAFTAFTLLTNNCHRAGMDNKNMPMIQNNNNGNNGQPQMNNNNGNNSNNNQPPEMPNNNQQPTEQNNQ